MADLHRLNQALRLPDSSLELHKLEEEGLSLHLLALANPKVILSAADIAYFWQKLPYWAFAWAGGRALARFIKAHPEQVEGKRVLDFGTGSGLVGIAAAQAGAKEVYIADLDPNALEAAKLNAALNQVKLLPVTANWPEVDVLLASDVLYDISSSADLQRLILNVPHWILAESQYVRPKFVELQCLARYPSATLPAIGDFDQAIDIEIYTRANASVGALFSN